jgi:hypothetical protein
LAPPKNLRTRAASDNELEWIKYSRKLSQDSPDEIDTQAKALVALATTLLTVYTGALTLFKIRENFDSFFPFLQGSILWLPRLANLMLPIVLWLWSIYSSLDVYQPKEYKTNAISPNKANETLNEIIKTKNEKMEWAIRIFFIAISWSAICIGFISLLTPQTSMPEPEEVQFIIPASSIPAFDSMSIAWDAKSKITAPVKLLEEAGDSIKVELEDGRKAKFNRTLIQGIIYLESQSNELNKTT